ncbi:hypothetical protein [Mycobacterium sp. E2479]|uniref:Abi-alpha family protein n=1 Tax=Mycobacterium sp. E2479 TaxID=1834134 RepID=UPI000801283E|nr:hypothetical protein [Mycobacterium sp. E2479]OBH50410.1 hypothetical protein A5686_13855 [Mycobacterium sp. E2479]
MYATRLIRSSFQTAADVMVAGVLPVVLTSERYVVGLIRQHLAQLDDAAGTSANGPPLAEAAALASPTDVLQSLLDRAIYNSPDDSLDDLHRALLEAMLPDEARILAALSDGSTYPVVHVAEPSAGASSVMALENASTVGRVAGVSLPDHTPLYLARMVHLGLAVIGPEGPTSMESDYEILLADDAVSLAQAKARRGIRPARVIKRTVRISALGQQVWDAAK